MARYHVGIDAGKKSHQACIRNLSHDTSSKVYPISCGHGAFLKLVSTLEKLSSSKDDFLIGGRLVVLIALP